MRTTSSIVILVGNCISISFAMRVIKSNSVQSTSLLVAYWRHLETSYASKPLIEDRPAKVLLDALLAPEAWSRFETSSLRPIGWDMLAVRTRVIDDWLLYRGPFADVEKAHDNTAKTRQLVNLGAGMCCRPYRLDLHTSIDRVLEVELDGSLLTIKHQVLEDAGYEPTTNVIPVEMDLLQSYNALDTLQEFGLELEQPIDWLAEGLFAYLDSKGHQSVLELAAHPQSRIAISLFEPECKELFLKHGVDLPWNDLVSSESVVAQAEEIGWELEKHVCGKDWNTLYQRDANLPGYNMIFLKWPE
jgi:methyltransferase (TIGR00027 family)